MKRSKYNGLQFLLLLAVIGLSAVLFTSSCGKGGVKNATSEHIGYQVINLSPTLGPVSLYINYAIYNNYNFYYPTPSGYFNLSSTQIPFQIRSSPNQLAGTVVIAGNIIVRNDTLKANTRYTLFVTGLKEDSTLNSVFLVDTSPAPSKGRGKVRFLNASPQAPNFDIAANGYLDTGFTNIAYQHVSKYVEMPAGNYNFQVYQHGDKTNVLGTLQNITIQDGRLYTLYSRGVVGHTIDTLAFGLGSIVNK